MNKTCICVILVGCRTVSLTEQQSHHPSPSGCQFNRTEHFPLLSSICSHFLVALNSSLDLKRFSVYGFRSKLQTSVDFPHTLDLNDFASDSPGECVHCLSLVEHSEIFYVEDVPTLLSILCLWGPPEVNWTRSGKELQHYIGGQFVLQKNSFQAICCLICKAFCPISNHVMSLFVLPLV